MITKFQLDMVYERLNSFQSLYAYIVDECLIEPLPQGKDMDVRIFPEGIYPEEFAIVIDLRIPKHSRKWYYD